MSSATTSQSQPLNIFAIGASRNIGYYASLKLLQSGATVTFLLRNPTIFDNDTAMQPFISSKSAHIVKGDALVKGDVARAWAEAMAKNDEGRVDYLLFTLGGIPKFSLSKGFALNPPNLVTVSILNTLSTLPPSLLPSVRVITISSTGLTPSSHDSLPTLMKPLYGVVLASPHNDKVGAERVLHHLVDGWSWTSTAADDKDPSSALLPENWQSMEGLPKEGELKHVVVIRPSLLMDGESKGEKYDELKKQGKELPNKGKRGRLPYRVSTESELGGYTVTRKDVAHFIVELIQGRWDEFENKVVNISE
ncbi:hypothetical protein NP233_g7535 [Leucocoprinus birnbaumii]|uniref:NAD(P)-binding domain-containing protein n=1 Tax=Leucocoprinus birnbaumii TaxID=56174 RepID=A0AAD5VP52_9AGAR|nr:hypothetical protein NP233_g7535 [Leucocoprinus birnbaumii]